MLVNQYVVLHSGDRILMKVNKWVEDIKEAERLCNVDLSTELKYYVKDIQETASHIELVHTHKDHNVK